MFKYWRDPGYWRWWWLNRVSGDTKFFLVFLVALIALAGGFAAASTMSPDDTSVVVEKRVITLTHIEPGGTRVVRKEVTLPARVQAVLGTQVQRETRLVTVQRDGKTVYLRVPAETLPGQTVGGTRTDTVVRTETTERVNNVTTPGTTVVMPGRERTVVSEVTLPARTVTNEVTGPTRTVTNEVTQPTRTVTSEVTVTLPPRTVTDVETVTTTVTSPPETVTVTVKK